MNKTSRLIVTLATAGSILALPVAVQADPGKSNGKGHTKSSKGAAKRCAKTQKVGFNVQGTLVSVVADDPATPLVNERTVTITVTGANSHARNSGELADQDAAAEGVQVTGATYTVPSTDAYELNLNGYEAPDTMSPGDAVNVSGKVARTKKKCAAAGTSTADRYGTVDVRKVTVTDSDPDA